MACRFYFMPQAEFVVCYLGSTYSGAGRGRQMAATCAVEKGQCEEGRQYFLRSIPLYKCGPQGNGYLVQCAAPFCRLLIDRTHFEMALDVMSKANEYVRWSPRHDHAKYVG